MNHAPNFDSKPHAEKSNPTSRTDFSSKTLRNICLGHPVHLITSLKIISWNQDSLWGRQSIGGISSGFRVGQLLSHISNSSPDFLKWNTRGSQFSLFGQNRQCSHLSSRETMVLVNPRSICWCVLFIQNTVSGVKQYHFKRNEWQNQWFAFLISSCQ